MILNHRKQPTGRGTVQSKLTTKNQMRQFQQWMEDRQVSFTGPPPVVVVLLFMMERAAGTWFPLGSHLQRGLKYESLRAIPSAIADHYRTHGHNVDHLVNSEAIRVLLHNFKARLSLHQVAHQRAVPLVAERAQTVVGLLRGLVDRNIVHPVWALRWIAAILVARVAGLRSTEVVRLRHQWISRCQTSEGPGYLLSVPYSKHQNTPRIVAVTPGIPGGAEAVAVLDEWITAARQLGYAFAGQAPLFPRVLRVRGKRALKSVAGKTLAEFPHLVAQLVTQMDPASTAAGSNRTVDWRCVLGHSWNAIVYNRTAGDSECPDCSKLRTKLGSAPRPSDPVVLVDPIRTRLAHSTFHPEMPRPDRMGRAMLAAAQEYESSYGAIVREAGLEPRDEFEAVAANGPRRGISVDLARAGVDRETIARHLRHAHPDVSIPYIDERDLEPPSPLSGLPGWDD